jgi:5-methyltetrahydrofolate--homocysteine methyltransferase
VDAEQREPYAPGVFYCKDAFEGLESVDQLQDPDKRAGFVARIHAEARREAGAREAPARRPAHVKSAVAGRAAAVPTAPAWGPRLIEHMPLELVFECLDRDELFRLSWGAKNAHGAEWQQLKLDFEARLAAMRRRALAEQWFAPRAVYGYWPAQSDGDDLLVFDPASVVNGNQPRVVQRFSFPRQPAQDHLCLADYFASTTSGRLDLVAFQVVTLGPRPTELVDGLQARGAYSDAYYLHGLAVQTAEATAEYAHRHIRRELGLAAGQGKRYSWGYPAIPELDDHRKLFDLLPAEARLGMSLSAAFQLIPEQSTAAIVIHHPDARYYNVGGSRIDQLEREMEKVR